MLLQQMSAFIFRTTRKPFGLLQSFQPNTLYNPRSFKMYKVMNHSIYMHYESSLLFKGRRWGCLSQPQVEVSRIFSLWIPLTFSLRSVRSSRSCIAVNDNGVITVSNSAVTENAETKYYCTWAIRLMVHVMSQPNKVPSVWHTNRDLPLLFCLYPNVSQVTRHCDTDLQTTHTVTDYTRTNRWHNLTWQAVLLQRSRRDKMLSRWKYSTVHSLSDKVISDR